MEEPLIQNDAIVFGILMVILALVFATARDPRFKTFYRYLPTVLLCYLIPSILNTFGVISGEKSQLYFVASRYLLPACLVLLTISIDFKAIRRLGGKALIMFATATVGILIGGPLAFWLVGQISPALVQMEGEPEAWRGLTTIAGSWMGGGANQTAMKEVFNVSGQLFAAMVAVDIIVANLWMAFLLYGAGIADQIDRWLQADSSAIREVQKRIEDYQASIAQIPQLHHLMLIGGVGFGCTALAHLGADLILPVMEANAAWLEEYGLTSLASGFFWIVVIATTLGLGLSFTKVRDLEGVGASKVGSLFIFILVATIGMHMDLSQIQENPGFFLVGLIWILIHISLLLLVAKLIKAPFFFVAVGSQANIGGAASAPIVASAFHPTLAPVGVLLAVLGYAIGTYGGILCGFLLELVA